MLDVIVVGGGPAGAVAARRLAQAGRRVLLVDASAGAGEAKIGEALVPAARPLLRDLGLWERFCAFCAEDHLALVCSGNDSAWGSARLASTDFVYDPNGLGWHLDRARFDAFLRAEAAAAGAEVREHTAVRPHAVRARACVRGDDGGWEVALGDDGTSLRCRWLIDATGRQATVARHRGGRGRALDATVAVVVRLSAQSAPATNDRHARTLIEAAPDGWWYSALVPGARRVVVYVTDRDLLPRDARSAEGFVSLLQKTEHLWPRLDGYAVTGMPRRVAASGARMEPPAGERWIAVGDAAVAFDPLSSQGLFTALYTGMVGADAVHASLGGKVGAVDAYVARIATIADAYCRNRTSFYALEHRWPDRPFWHRRHSP